MFILYEVKLCGISSLARVMIYIVLIGKICELLRSFINHDLDSRLLDDWSFKLSAFIHCRSLMLSIGICWLDFDCARLKFVILSFTLSKRE